MSGMKINQETTNKYKEYLKFKEQENQSFTKQEIKTFQKIDNIKYKNNSIKSNIFSGVIFFLMPIVLKLFDMYFKLGYTSVNYIVPIIFGCIDFITAGIIKYRYNKYKIVLD